MGQVKNGNKFLEEMQRLNPEIVDEAEAIEFAMQNTPMVDEMTWFGPLGDGIYHANSRESRYFPGMTEKEAAQALMKETYL